MTDKFYTVDELAEMWGLHRTTVIGYILRRKLSATVIGRQYRISEEQLQDYLNANTIQRQAPPSTRENASE